MKTYNISYASPIETKIAWSQACFLSNKNIFKNDTIITDLLHKLKATIDSSHKEMMRIGIDQICKKCEQDEGGSCCGAGLEKKYDGILILINILIGIKLPFKRCDPKSCFFLGPSGCLLKARHVICINYMCSKITDKISPEQMSPLREKEGEEIELLFHLHEKLRKAIATARLSNG